MAKPFPKVRENGKAWKKGIFVGKDAVSNINLVRTTNGRIKSRTMRQCTPAFDVGRLAEACGTPWNHTQEQLIGRSTPAKRLPPASGIEALTIEGAPRSVPRPPSGGHKTGHSPSEGGPCDEAGADPPTTEKGDDEEDEQDKEEDPGEGQMGQSSSSSTSSRGGGAVRKRSGLSQDSEELIPGEDPPTSPKRNLEGRAEVSEQLKKEQQKFKRDQRKHRREKLQAACGE